MHQSEMRTQITYLYFCTLGGLKHPKTYTILRQNGSYFYTTYHIAD